ncbi:IclR family transcriptional regulator [Natrinema salsiterrestre]|uniref:IclR family transcriptional regulator n=1 Tax=Natrinema salsiterrestre TaxID=2950540 RepID=A0A9Q4L5B6_9EURY|nr:IclR family transcriptional regulator [Natrinema salsiterrestre]MDF9747849.1 IclR family transcriptional regulator [Natrinema salsiterrestre]
MATNTPRQIEAVQKTCRILEFLRDRGGAGVTEIAEELDISKSVVHAHLATLNDENLVVKDGHTYSLGLKFLDIAETVKNRVAKHEIVRDQVRALAEDTGEVVHFGAEENGRIVYVAKSKGEAAVETASKVGKRMPMHSTSLGKAILAEFPEDSIDRIVEQHGLPKQTERTITDERRLHEELDTTRKREYSIDDEENIPGVRCIGISVSAPEVGVLGALSISGPSQRMTDERIENELHEAIAQSANVIEVNSRYQ